MYKIKATFYKDNETYYKHDFQLEFVSIAAAKRYIEKWLNDGFLKTFNIEYRLFSVSTNFIDNPLFNFGEFHIYKIDK